MWGDAHIHMVLDGADYRKAMAAHRPTPHNGLIRARLLDYQKQQITFLRDGGDAFGVSLRARELAKEYGIDYRSPAFPIHKKGHYGSFIGKGFSDFDEYERLLDEVELCDGDFVKLMISGLIDFSKEDTLTEKGLSEQDIFTMVESAHKRGFAVMAHANGNKAVLAALSAGVESIEHGAFLSNETLIRMAQSNTVWVPTLSTIGNLIDSGRFPDEVLSSLLQKQQEKVAFFAAEGGLVGLGSDAGAFCVPHGQGASSEYAYLKEVLKEHTELHLAASEHFIKKHFKK